MKSQWYILWHTHVCKIFSSLLVQAFGTLCLFMFYSKLLFAVLRSVLCTSIVRSRSASTAMAFKVGELSESEECELRKRLNFRPNAHVISSIISPD
jgi:hypothetical protein